MGWKITDQRIPQWLAGAIKKAREDGKSEVISVAVRERDAVGSFAQFCMGSCHGDWSPEAELIYGEVWLDDVTFEFYRRQMDERHWPRYHENGNPKGFWEE